MPHAIGRRAASAALVMLCTTACAGGRTRDGARLLSLYTQRVQEESEAFARQRDAVARARIQNIGYLDQSALGGEREVATQLLLWRLTKDETRSNLYQGILEGTALAARQRDEALARRAQNARAVASAHGGVQVRQKQLSATARALAELAKKPDGRADARFLVAFVKDVRSHLDEERKNAEKEAKAAAGTAAKTTGTPK